MKLRHLFLTVALALFVLLFTMLFPSRHSSIVEQQESPQSAQQTEVVHPAEPLSNGLPTALPALADVDVDEQAQDEELVPISGEDISRLFIDDDNVVNGGEVERLLRGDLNQFIGRIASLEQENEMGATRASLLGDTLSALKDTRVYSQQFGCTGRICALTLVTDNLDQQTSDKIKKFDKNYTFIKSIKSETGETQFQAIYLQTDDPSTMRFKGY